MPPELAEALEQMEGAVITRSTQSETGARIIAVSDKYTFALVLEGCQWADERCERCSCDREKYTIRVERVP